MDRIQNSRVSQLQSWREQQLLFRHLGNPSHSTRILGDGCPHLCAMIASCSGDEVPDSGLASLSCDRPIFDEREKECALNVFRTYKVRGLTVLFYRRLVRASFRFFWGAPFPASQSSTFSVNATSASSYFPIANPFSVSIATVSLLSVSAGPALEHAIMGTPPL